MLHHEYDALKGYRFLGGAISFYSVSCMSDVIFNPSLLNWSSLILTVAHIFDSDPNLTYNSQRAYLQLMISALVSQSKSEEYMKTT